MAWLPSHQELRESPKLKRAARRLGVSGPEMVGHLHYLWWWALDHAPDGDLARFDAEDIADAADYKGDPEMFQKALMDCGPGESDGFIDQDGKLHDWDEYGGKYQKRVQAGRKAAGVRWHSDGNANASGAASQGQKKGNTEERRGEEKGTSASDDAGDFAGWWSAYPLKRDRAEAQKAYRKALTTGPKASRPSHADLVAGLERSKVIWARENRPLDKHPYGATWLNKRRWEDELPTEQRTSSTGINEAWADA